MHRKLPAKITFAIAALNEEQEITSFVEETHATVSQLLSDFELILVDDGSQDKTGEIMHELSNRLAGVKVIRNPTNLGLGVSYRRGLAEASGTYYMMLCGDGGFPAQSLPAVIAKVGTADIVVPNITNLRALKTPFRYFVSRLYTSLLNFVFGFNIGYYNGLPIHRVELLRKLDIKSQGFGFQAEILVKLLQRGHSYAQVDVLGAERVFTSKALRLTNVASVTTTLSQLVFGPFVDRQRLRRSTRDEFVNDLTYSMAADVQPPPKG